MANPSTLEKPQSDPTRNGADTAPDAPPEDPNTATVSFEFRGLTFLIPKRQGRWPIDAVREFARGRVIEGSAQLLGEKEWARLRTVCRYGDDLTEFTAQFSNVIRAECLP